jgi:uncharacterized spore protein YtfJ
MRLKKFITISIAFLFVWAVPLKPQEKSPVEESLIHFEKMLSNIEVNSVIGKPIRQGDITIIPFSKISFGLGAGGATMGFGGGMGGKTIPLGILIIEGEDVRVELLPQEEKKPSFLAEMLPALIQHLPELLQQKSLLSLPRPAEKAPEKPGKPAEKKSLAQVEKLFNEKKYKEALGSIDSLIAAEPNNADFHAWKGNIMGSLASSGNPLDMMKYGMGAMQEFETALKLDPNNVMGHFGRGVGRLMAPQGFGGDVDGAVEDLEFACKKGAFAEAYYYLGVAYQKKGLQSKAKEAFKKALELQPDYPEAAEALASIK